MPGHARPLLRLLPLTYAQYSLSRPSCIALADARQQHGAAGPQGDVAQSALGAGVLSKFLENNQFTTGGITLMVLGATAAAATAALRQVVVYGKRHLMVRAEIDSRDDAYRWLMHYLSHHKAFRNSSTVQVITSLQSFGTSAAQRTSDDKPRVLYVPAPGDHLLKYHGKWVWISRKRQAGNPQLAANARLLMETLVLSMWGTSRAPLEALVAEAAAAYFDSQKQRTIIHSVDQDGYWELVGSRPIRPLSTVVLPKHKVSTLVQDCTEFLESEEWYSHHGIPYRRGYLLYGPPGTGKTSLVMALAGALQLDIYVVTLSSPRMTDETLRSLLNTASPRSVLLLEDVDAAFVGREGQTGSSGSLTFSGLLNAIDGVAAQEGRLLFMTTNHIERLSDALIRPGRVDVRMHLGLATRAMIRRLFVTFYADLPHLEVILQPAAAKAPSAAARAPSAAATAPSAAAPAPGAADKTAASTAPTPQLDSSRSRDEATASSAEERERLLSQAAASSSGSSSSDECSDAVDSDRMSSHAATSELENGASSADKQQQGALKLVGSYASRELPHMQHGQHETYDAERRREALRQLRTLALQFAEQLPERSISMAAVQGHLMKHKKDPVGAVHAASSLLGPARQGEQHEPEEQRDRERNDKL